MKKLSKAAGNRHGSPWRAVGMLQLVYNLNFTDMLKASLFINAFF
jgi:hypothetical protein